MINDIGNIIIEKISALTWLDKYTGVVKIAQYNQPTEDGRVIKKSFPISCKDSDPDCSVISKYQEFCPDNKKKSVLFLEDKYVRFVKREGDLFFFQASYDMVAWLNIPLLGESQCSISSLALLSVFSALPSIPFSSGVYQRVSISPLGQESKARNPFAKYSFDESINQFLIYPYDYFILPINVDFVVNRKCIDEWILNDPNNC